jgi:hypothetical protein
MKKILFIIAIVTVLLTLAGNSFGQNGKNSKRKLNPKPFIGSPTDGNGIRKSPTHKAKAVHTIKSSHKRTSVKKPVRNLESPNGGMNTTDEAPQFGERKANPKDLVKGKTEGNPALLEFQIPEKIVTDNKHPETLNQRSVQKPKPRQSSLDGKGTDVNVEEVERRKSNSKSPKTKRKAGTKSIIILDQDTQTIKARRKRKRNK